MEIEQIKLRNYRQYRDATLIFATSAKQNLTVIQGANGAGKTNILNAVTWCFYGKEKHLEKKYEGFPLVNTLTLRKLEPGKRCKVEVQVVMRDKENKKIIVERIQEFQALKGGKMQAIGNPKFRVLQQVNGEIKSARDPEDTLSGLIPESIEEYFFFDGERLNDYFRGTSGEKIRNAVLKISQIGLLQNAIKHLNSKKKDFLKRFGDLSPEAEGIREKLNDAEGLVRGYEHNLGKLKKRKGKVEKEENEYSEKLRTSPISNVRELENKKRGIESELISLEDDIKRLTQERNDYLIETAPLIFAYNPITKIKQLISEREEAGDIPPDYKKNFLEKLLEKGKCICGTDISKGTNYRKKIEKLFQECDGILDISGELIEDHANLRTIIDELRNFRKKQIFYGKRIKRLEEERERKSKNLKKVKEKFKTFNSEQVRKWEQKLAERKGIKNGLIEQIAELKFHIKDRTGEVDRLTGELGKELEKEEKYEGLRKDLLFCDKGLAALRKIKDEIVEDVRKEIEEKTESQFFELIWKKETYKKVRINEEYSISVVDRYGMEGIGTLSAGERQVLALSFIAALNSVSGFDAPIIIDTPLGRISREPKGNIAKNLLNYLKGKQVILLVTEEEYTLEVREKLSQRVGKEYTINFKETQEGSEAEVIPYGIWEYKK